MRTRPEANCGMHSAMPSKKVAAKAASKRKTGRPRRDPDQPLSVPIGMRLKMLREYRGLDQAAVRAVIKVAPSTYSHIETGKTYPTIEQVVALARWSGVSADVLLGLKPLVLE